MRSKTQRSARSSEEVGRQIAGEMSEMFSVSLDRNLNQDLVKRRMSDAVSSLRAALYEAVEGFNGQAPWDYHLAVLNRGDRLLFNSFGQFTLTVTFGDDQVLIHPARDHGRGQSPMVVEILSDDGDLRYRGRVMPPAQQAPQPQLPVQTQVLTELQFVDSLIRMACLRHAEPQGVC